MGLAEWFIDGICVVSFCIDPPDLGQKGSSFSRIECRGLVGHFNFARLVSNCWIKNFFSD